MKVQDYDDWRRMLEACAVGAAMALVEAGGPSVVVTESHAIGELNRPDPPSEPGVFWVIASALGIDKRRRLEWHDPGVKPGKYICTNPDIEQPQCWAQLYSGGWSAGRCNWLGQRVQVRVTGHPTHESAIEHLERLLGREDNHAGS